MRKVTTILIIVIILLGATLMTANADSDTIDYDFVSGEQGYYYNFIKPAEIAVNSDGFAVYDNNEKIIIIRDEERTVIPFNKSIKEMLMISDYLFVMTVRTATDFSEIYVYNINSGELIQDITDILNANSANPSSMAADYVSDTLYIINLTDITAYTLEYEDELEISSQSVIFTASPIINFTSSMIFNNGSLLLYNSGFDEIYRVVPGETEFTTLLNNIPKINYILANDSYLLIVVSDRIVRYKNTESGYLYEDIILTIGGASDATVSDIGGVCLYNNLLYVANPSYSAVKVFTLSTALTLKHMYGSRGTSIRRLNTPTDTDINGNNLYIADSLNDRVMNYKINSDNIITEFIEIGASGDNDGEFIRPHIVAADYTDGLYVADSTGRLQYFYRNNFIASYDFNDITSVAVSGDDTVYVLDTEDKKIYAKSKSDTEFWELITFPTAPLNIAVSKAGKILYVSDEDGLISYSIDGRQLPFNIDYADYGISGIKDLLVDYGGNIYISTKGESVKIYRFVRNINAYALADEYTLDDENKSVDSVKGMSLSSDGRIFAANPAYHNIMVIDNSQAVGENAPPYPHPTEVLSVIKIAYVLSDSTLYMRPDNFEDISVIQADSCLIVLNEVSHNSIHYYYVEIDGVKAYIRQSDTALLQAGAPSVTHIKSLHPTLDIYMYPSLYAPKVFPLVGRDNIIEVVSNVAEKDGEKVINWYEVKYMNATGYVPISEVVAANIEPATETFTYKVKASRLGEQVELYSLPDTHSAVLAKLPDGAKVTLDGEVDGDSEFTLIRYKDYTGYIKTGHLIKNGLTTGQILSIVLASVAFIATCAVIVIYKIILKENY